MRRDVTLWMPIEEISQIEATIREHLPLECGGMLFGFWANTTNCVVKALSSSGPQAIHTRYSYKPDGSYDEEIAAEMWNSSKGRLNYLGDWHSHPNTSIPYLSFRDRITLDKITAATSSNQRPGLSVVFATSEHNSSFRAWFGLGLRFLRIPIPVAFGCTTKLY